MLLHNILQKFKIIFYITKIQPAFLLNGISFRRYVLTFLSQFLTSTELANGILAQETHYPNGKFSLIPKVLYHLLESWKQMENIYQPIIFSSLPSPKE